MKKIEIISKGVRHEILVDNEDYQKLSQYTWGIQPSVRTFYAITFIKNKRFKMEKLIVDVPQGKIIDHINHNGLDNRKENLRICTQQQNLCNTRSQKGSSSKYKGVSWHTKRKHWVAQIVFNEIFKHLGCFQDEIEAAKAYDKAALELHREFACTNFNMEGK